MYLVRGSLGEAHSQHQAIKAIARGKRIDYQYLQNPFPDEEEETNETLLPSNEELYAIIAGDEFTTLKDAEKSSDWPEWENAIHNELTQLQQMGTWRLVTKPPDAVPIANKWTFIKKRNKAGDVIKYKARLVAKGCAQRPGYDYVETFSPVVRMETKRNIEGKGLYAPTRGI